MEIGADFSHDEGKDDLLALRAALDNYHRADEPWVEKPFEATLLTAARSSSAMRPWVPSPISKSGSPVTTPS